MHFRPQLVELLSNNSMGEMKSAMLWCRQMSEAPMQLDLPEHKAKNSEMRGLMKEYQLVLSRWVTQMRMTEGPRFREKL